MTAPVDTARPTAFKYQSVFLFSEVWIAISSAVLKPWRGTAPWSTLGCDTPQINLLIIGCWANPSGPTWLIPTSETRRKHEGKDVEPPDVAPPASMLSRPQCALLEYTVGIANRLVLFASLVKSENPGPRDCSETRQILKFNSSCSLVDHLEVALSDRLCSLPQAQNVKPLLCSLLKQQPKSIPLLNCGVPKKQD